MTTGVFCLRRAVMCVFAFKLYFLACAFVEDIAWLRREGDRRF